MSTENLKDFIEERLRAALGTDVDLDEGSPLQEQVVEPILEKLEPDPLAMDVDLYITTLLEQQFPNHNFREGSGVRDLLVKPAELMLEPVNREIKFIQQGQTAAYPSLLSRGDADGFAANVFVTRDTGGLSTGVARVVFAAPQAVNVAPTSNYCTTAAGLKYYPTTLQSISAESMAFNQLGTEYYFDINLTAEKAGAEYDIAKNTITSIASLSTATRIYNPEAFTGGLNDQSNQELLDQSDESITERSLVTARGIVARIKGDFASVKHVQTVGYTDPEMMRDIITGGDMGPALWSGNDGATADDGDGDAVTDILVSRYHDFEVIFGGSGPVTDYYVQIDEISTGANGVVPATLDRFQIPGFDFTADDVGNMMLTTAAPSPANVGFVDITAYVAPDEVELNRVGANEGGITWVYTRHLGTFEIDEVVSPTELRIATETLPIDKPTLLWSIHKKEITLSDIPGGIVSTVDAAALKVQADEIHIGGCTDIYVRGTSTTSTSMGISAISDENPLVEALTLNTDASTVIKQEFVWDTTKDFKALGVKPGHALEIIGSLLNANTYVIINVGVDDTGAPDVHYLQLATLTSATESNLKYRILDELDIDLTGPRTMRTTGTDMSTMQASVAVTTAAATDFLAVGGAVGDVLKLTSGPDEGEHTVNAILGTGNRTLALNSLMTATHASLPYELYKKQTGISLPLIRVEDVDLLDASGNPTGDIIPYSKAVFSSSSEFVNAGRGVKVTASDCTVGIVGSMDLTGMAPLANPTIINIDINGAGAVAVDLSLAISGAQIVSLIDAAIPNIATLLDIDGESRLCLRSADRWISVSPHANNANVGFDAVIGEDNRFIRSAADVADWRTQSYGLVNKKDAVHIQSGSAAGFYYLVANDLGELTVVGVGKTSGRVFFPAPSVGVKVSVGSRSYGTARVYFTDPTSVTMRGGWRPELKDSGTYPANGATNEAILQDEPPITWFTLTAAGQTLNFVPDPDLEYKVLPVGTEVADNLSSDGTNIVFSTAAPALVNPGQASRNPAIDFLKREILPGDRLRTTYQPIQSTRDLVALPMVYPTDLLGKTLIFTLDNAPQKTVTFTNKVTSIPKIAERINAQLGETVAYIESGKYLRIEADFPITLHKDSTAAAGGVLWTITPPTNLVNRSSIWSEDGVLIEVVAPVVPTTHTRLQLPTTPATSQSNHFEIYRPGVQRICSKDMLAQLEGALYYMDVELVSEGPGDLWNIPADLEFTITGYESDGYYLTNENRYLAFSTEEHPWIHVSRRMLKTSVDDRPDLATTLNSQNIQIGYDYSPVASTLQSFASSDLDRVLVASVLVRHLVPHYLNFTMSYNGGSAADIVKKDILAHLEALGPDERVEVSDLTNIARKRGANYIQFPTEIVAVVHDEQRKVTVIRSKDYVSKGRWSTFFPGEITIVREVTTTL